MAHFTSLCLDDSGKIIQLNEPGRQKLESRWICILSADEACEPIF